jgi:hypothetical protein
MALHSQNGNGRAVTILPPTPSTISGRSLAHQHRDARQKACLAADVLAGLTAIDLTQAQLATLFGVSVAYIQVARGLDPGKRAAIVRGWDPTPFAKLRKPRRKVSANQLDELLEGLIRTLDVDRALEAAVAIERIG